MKPPSPELRKLVDQVLDQEGMSKLDVCRLEDLMHDPAALDYYADLVTHEALMKEALEGVTGVEPRRWIIPFPVKILLRSAAAAAFFALGFLIRGKDQSQAKVEEQHSPAPSDVSTTRIVSPARITGLMGVQWSSGTEPDLLGSQGNAKRLSIRTGLVELTYASGVRVTLEGPADYSTSDETSGNLAGGKLVAYVPPGAEGFHVDYPKGRVVDLGTEFAMDVRSDGKTELGVFDGKVQLHVPGQEVRLLTVNQALMHDDSTTDPVSSIPLDREKFVRRLPARDFRWEVTSGDPKRVEFDVTHLIWKSADYRALFKCIQGPSGVGVSDVMLCLDGEPVSVVPESGSTGPNHRLVRNNLMTLPVSSSQYRPGKWTLRATLTASGKEPRSLGIVQFEEGLVASATPENFIGTWRYFFGGIEHKRQFMADGTMRFYKGGKQSKENFVHGKWWVEDGVLYQSAPESDNLIEQHVLRNANTLIFVNQPYENAVRVPDP